MSRTVSTTSMTSYLRLNPEAGRRIRIYRNGDAHHKGITIVLNVRKIHDINAFLDAVSEKIGLILGAKRLFTLDGIPITSTEQLEHNKEYVATSGSAFIPLLYGQSPVQPTPGIVRRGSTSTPGSRFARQNEDTFALSSASKKSAPADLHTPLRQSRSTEPRKTGVASRSVTSMATGPTNVYKQSGKSTDKNKRRESSKDRKSLERKKKGAKAKDENTERGKKKTKEKPAVEPYTTPAASPILPASDEPTRPEESEVLEENVSVHNSPIARTKTEVEVVEHDNTDEAKDGNEEEANVEEELIENGNEGSEAHTIEEGEHERPKSIIDATDEKNRHTLENEEKKGEHEN